MNTKTVEKFMKVFSDGIEPGDLPVVLADVYQDVVQVKGLSKKDIQRRCEDIIYYIIDNTSAGRYDEEIDEVVRGMVPGMVVAFMNIKHAKYSIKKCCSCL